MAPKWLQLSNKDTPSDGEVYYFLPLQGVGFPKGMTARLLESGRLCCLCAGSLCLALPLRAGVKQKQIQRTKSVHLPLSSHIGKRVRLQGTGQTGGEPALPSPTNGEGIQHPAPGGEVTTCSRANAMEREA